MFWKSIALLLYCFLILLLINSVSQEKREQIKCAESHFKCIEAQRKEDKRELERLQSEWELQGAKRIGETGRRLDR